VTPARRCSPVTCGCERRTNRSRPRNFGNLCPTFEQDFQAEKMRGRNPEYGSPLTARRVRLVEHVRIRGFRIRLAFPGAEIPRMVRLAGRNSENICLPSVKSRWPNSENFLPMTRRVFPRYPASPQWDTAHSDRLPLTVHRLLLVCNGLNGQQPLDLAPGGT